MSRFTEPMYDLIVKTSTVLPPDAMAALAAARSREDAEARSGIAMTTIALNVDMARRDRAPICQDTGMPTFEVHAPDGYPTLELEEGIREALARATAAGILRPNSVDSITGENQGNGGTLYPVVHLHHWREPHVQVRLILKGGGCENKSAQYSLPAELDGLGKAGRDLDGVRKCILHALYMAQGQGCSPGFIGVGVGGDRGGSYDLAKAQLLRPLDDVNPDPQLAALEKYILDAGNTLGVGTMGFGGEVTVAGCKVAARNRLPASFFVSVAYNCWAFRRQGVDLDPETLQVLRSHYEDIKGPEWLGTEGDEASLATGDVRRLTLPVTEEEVRSLEVGDVVLLSGTIYTGRDRFHQHHMDHDAPQDLRGSAIYHCGPVMLKQGDTWRVMAAGPTTSIREEPYQADIIGKFGIRMVIGKGGMGRRTLSGLAEHGAVYLTAVGGAAQYYARCVRSVPAVDYLEFGVPEAMWHLEVKDFPAFVTMDSHGESLHADVDRSSLEKLSALAARVL